MERDDRKLDVVLRMGRIGRDPEESAEETARPLSEIKSMEVLSPTGGAVPLAEIGHFRKVVGEERLRRHNLQFSLSLLYSLEPRVNRGMVEQSVRSLLKEARLPAGCSAEIVGEGKKIDENLQQLRWMLLIIVVLIFMVMASVFESLLSPFVIMFSLPFAAIGVLWGLVLTGSSLEELGMLGVVILAGIVVNNGIVMMDFLSMLRRERHYRRTAAVITACRARLRPILMTALTTTLGLLPMAFRSAEDVNWSGLAIVIISGLSVSTILTLVIIPAMLMNIEDALTFFKRQVLKVWRWRWVLYFLSPGRMRAKRLELVPAGMPASFAPTFAIAMRRVSQPEEETRTDSFDAEATQEKTASSQVVGIEVRHVRMVYPVFRPRRLLHVIPSTRYKYGARPPEGVEALCGINLSIGKGMYGFLGPNGAGKTTLLHIITGMIRPTCGFATVNGLDVAGDRRSVSAEIGYLPQSFGLYGNFTAREYLNYYSLIVGIHDRAERRRNVDAVLDQVNLVEAADRPVGTFSGGMRQRLGIARLLLTLPRVIIVDEPTAGLDPIERVKFRVLLSQLAQDRVVLLSTHIIDDISSSCRRLAVLHEGRIVYEGTPAGLVDSARNRIWEVTGRFEDEAAICERYSLLHKKAAGDDRVLFRFIGETCDLPGAQRVEPSLEDAYILATMKR
jgi:ABC-type multidrug transport system ATPase subunit